MKHCQQLLVWLSCLWLIASCSRPGGIATTNPSHTLPTPTLTNIAATSSATSTLLTPEPTSRTNIGIQATPYGIPTYESIFESTEQITDGRLKLIVKELDEKCYKPGSRIPLTITYDNLTAGSLTIVDYNVISIQVLFEGQGQLFPVITTTNNRRVFSPEYFMNIDTFNLQHPTPQALPPQGAFDVSVDYYFPLQMVEFDQHGQQQIRPMPSGQYLLKFVYIGFKGEGSWEGAISSNQVKMCIIR